MNEPIERTPCPDGYERAAKLLAQVQLRSMGFGPQPDSTAAVDIELDQRIRVVVHELVNLICERASQYGVTPEKLVPAIEAADFDSVDTFSERLGTEAVRHAEGLVDED